MTIATNAGQIGNEFEWSQAVRVNEDEGASEIGVTVGIDEADVEDSGAQSFSTNYDANNVTIDRPMSKDLNSKEANQALMDYGLKLLQMSDETEATDN